MNELDRADVDTACRLRGEEHAEIAAHLAGDDDLLLVAAREGARRQRCVSGANVECRDLAARVARDPVDVQGVDESSAREMMLLA